MQVNHTTGRMNNDGSEKIELKTAHFSNATEVLNGEDKKHITY